MTTTLQRTLYTAHASVTGGRDGHGATDDGALDVQLRAPKETGGPGGGTNPEQLFAVGYAACFQSALGGVARREKVDVSAGRIDSGVSLGPVEGGAYGIAVTLDVFLPGFDQETAERLVEAAHKVCPYSNATRGNIDVTLTVHTPAL
jgi:lipoyl-dependent peroxiredoxin